jgi:transposase
MAQTVSVLVNAPDRIRLERIAGDRNTPIKHAQRARLVLRSADRLPVQQVAASVGISRPMVWRWQQRFAEGGVDALLFPSHCPGATRSRDYPM